MNSGDSNGEIVTERMEGLGVITLNRPAALNALTLEMIRAITGILQGWKKGDSLKAVLFAGAGARAFCAGGDLKAFYRLGMDARRGDTLAQVPAVFFAEEYALNRTIFHYPKPTIALMDGITMGGGFGIAGNCAFRIATEKTVLAMPETGIGFFPDVGSVYHLLRCPMSFGRYMALTGLPVKAHDAIHAGLADYFLSSDISRNVAQNLAGSDLSQRSIAAFFKERSGQIPLGEFSAMLEATDAVFRIPNIYALFVVLEKEKSGWKKSALEALRKRSPSSLLVTMAHLNRSEGKSFDEVIKADFILARRFLERMDLYEGIRAVLIDKDNAPRWEPGSLDDISEDDVEAYFRPAAHGFNNKEVLEPDS